MNKKVIIIAVIIGAVALWYFFIYKKSATGAAANPGGGLLGALGPQGGTVPNPSTSGSQTLNQGAVATGAPNSSDVSTVQSWFNSFANTDAKNRALSLLSTMTADELSQLAYIIKNVWSNGITPTTSQATFIQNWSTKYGL